MDAKAGRVRRSLHGPHRPGHRWSRRARPFGDFSRVPATTWGSGRSGPYVIRGEPTVVERDMVLMIEALMGRRETCGASFEQAMPVTADDAEVLNADCPSRWWH